ncbi:MAG: DUF4402 domain-containing protein [Gammaproteobacteria bacterium]|nr:DUF4402 domain-containing protein [Gammaproteobacteria bacterium]
MLHIKIYIRLLFPIILLLVMQQAHAAAPSCKKTINLRATQGAPLSFGDLLVSGAGNAVVGTNGSRFTNGLIIPANGIVSAAELVVTGCQDTPYSISVQPSTTLVSGNASMLVDGFTTAPSLGLLDIKGKQSLFIGATLHVNDAQVAGAYTGTFLVEVIYQ